MLTDNQLKEIREHLENAKNPIFFFDNDADGLCSFILLRRYIGRGKGVAIKGVRELNKEFFKKAEEGADSIFILDNSRIGKDFIALADEKNIPIICIDHHDIEKPEIEFYYNSFKKKEIQAEPTSYLCYHIAEEKDMWLAALGCIADAYLPEFISEFKKSYPELLDNNFKTAFDIFFNTEFGRVIKIISYGLYDSTTNVVSMMRYMISSSNIYDLLEENSKTRSFHKRYGEIRKKIQSTIDKVEEAIEKEKNFVFLTYTGDMSVSQYTSDELMYRYPEKTIILGFIKGNSAKFSLRGPIDVNKLVCKAIKGIEGASGGGHIHSAGAQISAEDVPKFKENIIELLENQ